MESTITAEAQQVSRRSFLRGAMFGAGGLALYAGVIERHWLEIVYKEVAIGGLPTTFDGMKVAQLSDIHLNEFTEPFLLRESIDEINRTKPVHVVTLEDPVEFLHPHKVSTFNQREMGVDFDTYANGLRAALRQAPKVILVGEMRDQETVKIALSAAETGHLVLSTLHTINAGETVNRILGMFEPEEQEQVRIRLGESEGKTFYEIIEASYTFGWRHFDQACLEAYEQGLITEEDALLYCTKRSVVSRGIDNLKKGRGEVTSDVGSLRMRAGMTQGGGGNSSNAGAASLKLK